MHNHPSGKTFSHKDILNLADNTNCAAISVVGNDGKNCYLLEKLDDYNEVGFAIECSRLDDTMNNLIADKTKTVDDAYKLIEEFFGKAEKYGVRYITSRN